MSENILVQLKSQYEFLTKVEKKIADLVFSDPEKFTTFSTAKVAKLCDVSPGSINNFARKFCPDGFSFFKLEVAKCVSNNQTISVEENLSKGNGALKIMERKIRENISALCNTLEINDETAIEKTVEMIMAANKIEIYGIFQSGIVAKNFSFKLLELGIPASYEGDGLMFSVSSSMLTDKDLVIAISASGTSKDVYDAVMIAKKNGVPVICLTSNQFSPIAKISDEIILTTHGHGSSADKMDKMRMSQLLVVDTICALIRRKLNKNGIKIYEKLENILLSHSIK